MGQIRLTDRQLVARKPGCHAIDAHHQPLHVLIWHVEIDGIQSFSNTGRQVIAVSSTERINERGCSQRDLANEEVIGPGSSCHSPIHALAIDVVWVAGKAGQRERDCLSGRRSQFNGSADRPGRTLFPVLSNKGHHIESGFVIGEVFRICTGISIDHCSHSRLRRWNTQPVRGDRLRVTAGRNQV